MKKLRLLIYNVYRVCMVNPPGRKQSIRYKEKMSGDPDVVPDAMLHRIITSDILPFEADPQIQTILRQRVRKKDHPSVTVKNSLTDIFLPLFSSRHLEIKMAVVSIALFIMIGLGQKNNRTSDRKMHLFFLADSLGDSSSLHHAAARDTAFRVLYK